MKIQMLVIAAAVAAAPALAFAAPAPMAEDARQVTVSYTDVNLNAPAGQAVVKARIAEAAAQACGPRPDLRDPRAFQDFNSCVRDAARSANVAVASMTSPSKGAQKLAQAEN